MAAVQASSLHNPERSPGTQPGCVPGCAMSWPALLPAASTCDRHSLASLAIIVQQPLTRLLTGARAPARAGARSGTRHHVNHDSYL